MHKKLWPLIPVGLVVVALVIGYFSIEPDLRPSFRFAKTEKKVISPVFAGESKELFSAVQSEDKRKLSALLSKTPGLADMKRDDGQTALLIAVINGKKELADILISGGADVNLKDNGGWTPLMRSVTIWCPDQQKCREGMTDMAEFLIEKGARLNDKRDDGQTALMIASANGNEEIVRLLIAKGADVNILGLWNTNALRFAVNNKHSEIEDLLRKQGAVWINQ